MGIVKFGYTGPSKVDYSSYTNEDYIQAYFDNHKRGTIGRYEEKIEWFPWNTIEEFRSYLSSNNLQVVGDMIIDRNSSTFSLQKYLPYIFIAIILIFGIFISGRRVRG